MGGHDTRLRSEQESQQNQRSTNTTPAPVLGLRTASYCTENEGTPPLALAGAAVAGYHSLLAAGLVPRAWVPCAVGVSCADQKLDFFYGIELPWLSLTAFIVIAVSLCLYLRKTAK